MSLIKVTILLLKIKEGCIWGILDLFCGCGGMSWGLHKASDKFNIVAGIDNDVVALQTFKRNHTSIE